MISFRGFMESSTSDFIQCMLAKRCEDWAKRKCMTRVLPGKEDDFGHQTAGSLMQFLNDEGCDVDLSDRFVILSL